MRSLPLLLLTALVPIGLVASGCDGSTATDPDSSPSTDAASTLEVVPLAQVEWELLNEARGDASPRAGTLWGDRNGTVPTGFLATFVDGFSSPPHIHNATYRATVIEGTIHNDDPDAARMWMPPGSFWTQPIGEVHITAARGESNMALVEIDNGPYLVLPPEEAFDSGERPINVDAANLVWVGADGGAPRSGEVQVAHLWGSLREGESNGTFVQLPAGRTSEIRSHGSVFRAVVIAGQPQHAAAPAADLEPGSYFGSSDASVHRLTSSDAEDTVLYVRTNGSYDVGDAQR